MDLWIGWLVRHWQDQWRAVPTPAGHLYGAAPCEDMTLADREKTCATRRFWRRRRPYFGQAVSRGWRMSPGTRKKLTEMILPSWILDSGISILYDFIGFFFVDLHGWQQGGESPQIVSDDSDDNDGLAAKSERPRWSRFLRENWGHGSLGGGDKIPMTLWIYECLWIYVFFSFFFVMHYFYVHAGTVNIMFALHYYGHVCVWMLAEYIYNDIIIYIYIHQEIYTHIIYTPISFAWELL